VGTPGRWTPGGAEPLCTGHRDDGACPAGSAGWAGGAGGVCWPVSPEDTGCATSRGGDPLFALFGLGLLVVITRRRRR